ncbi:MAG TPA: thiol reductant ABC exporter subunit CydC, partial [Chloroflexota bacterium]|nr:thiol reductant ABC exporter subunit CydC [Chloroflexota bacterium]
MFFDPRLYGLTRGVRLRLLGAGLLGLLAVGAGVTRLAFSGFAIARVLQGAEVTDILPLLLGVAALVVIRSALQYQRDVVAHHTAAMVKIALRDRLYHHALALGPGYFDQRRTGEVLLSFVDAVEQLDTYFGQYLPQLFVAVVTPPLIFLFMATLDVQVALVFLVFALVTLLIPGFLRSKNARSSEARRLAYGAYGAEFLDSVQGLGTLKSFGQAKARGEVLAEKARHLYKTTMWILGVNIGTGGLSMLGVSAGAATALGLGALRVSTGELPLSSLVVILMLGVEVFRPIRELVQLFHQGILAQASAQGIFALLDTPIAIKDASAVPAPSGDPRPEIVFDDVAFGYQDGARPALKGVSFTLNAGETLGVVGPSGAGKSTLVWLLLRFVDPQSGCIRLGGRDLREIPLAEIRQHIAVVTQDTYLFHGTVAENLRLGKPDASQEEIEAAARFANAHEFIRSLPTGYETVVGERGARLSGGQRQRIAIARALLKDAPILVLDEALSSVDAENEATIQEALDRLMAGRTTLVIAHRLSSVIGADRVIVLDQGQVVESGTHRELIGQSGLYSQLMALQQSDLGEVDQQETLPVGNGHAQALEGVAQPTTTIAIASNGAHDHGPDGHGAHANGHGEHGHTHVVQEDEPVAEQLETNGSSGNASAPRGERIAPGNSMLPRLNSGDDIPVTTVWRRLFAIVRPWWGYLTLTFVTGLAHHASIIGLGAASALLVGAVATGQSIQGWLTVLAIMVVLSALLTWAETWFAHDLAYMLLAEMRIDAYNTLEPLAPAYLVRRRSGDLVSIAGGDVETVELFFAHTITPAFVAVMVPVTVLLILGALSWPIALVLLPFLVAVGASPFFAQRIAERLGAGVRHEIGYVHAFMVDSIQGLKEIAAFGQGEARAEAVTANGWKLADLRGRLLSHQSFQAGFIEAMIGLAGLAVLTTGAVIIAHGGLPRWYLPLITVLSLSAFGPVTELAKTAKELVETLASARRLFAVQDEPVPVLDGPGVPPTSTAAPPRIEMESVTFRYGEGEPQALESVSIVVEPGETVALVGSSGAGKTTCAHLLMRFWDPDHGCIRLDDHPLQSFELDDLRRRIALVSQDTYLFNTSLRDNLRLGKPGATDEEVIAAARQANAHDFIAALPDGYDTSIGERGVQLSGGQRQRIAIARAILKNAQLLILDEATSHLDAVNEREVRDALARLMVGRTTLVIAHRLSTIRDADKIVV